MASSTGLGDFPLVNDRARLSGLVRPHTFGNAETASKDVLTDYFFGAVTAVEATASITEANDTLSADAVTSRLGTASVTEADDTLSATGTVAIVGTASITEADDTVSAEAVTSRLGIASITEADDTLSATGESGGAGTGTASITEADDTLAATGTLAITGVASVTEADDSVSATGTLAITGTASITEADDTLVATNAAVVEQNNQRGDYPATEEDYEEHLKSLRRLKARRKKLEEKKRKNAEELRAILRSAMGLDAVASEAQEMAQELQEIIPAAVIAPHASSASAVNLRATEAKLNEISQRIEVLQQAIAQYEADQADEDDMETLLLLAA